MQECPDERQEYTYYAKDKSEVFWIHFTGTDCEKLLSDYQIHSCHIGENVLFKTLFQEIILELQKKEVLNLQHFKFICTNTCFIPYNGFPSAGTRYSLSS